MGTGERCERSVDNNHHNDAVRAVDEAGPAGRRADRQADRQAAPGVGRRAGRRPGRRFRPATALPVVAGAALLAVAATGVLGAVPAQAGSPRDHVGPAGVKPVARPKPVAARPKPMAARPKAMAARPKAMAARPKPMATVGRSKPVVAPRRPVAARPKPMATPNRPALKLATGAGPRAAGAATDCLARPFVSRLTGPFSTQQKGRPMTGSTVDARSLTGTMSNGWLVNPKAATGVCWLGGRYRLTVDDTVSRPGYVASPRNAWAQIWHHNGGVTTKNGNSGWVWDGLSISHVGDAFNISDGSQGFEIRNVHLSDIRDDCVQNDKFHAGSVHHSFLDGCYVAFSARASGAVPDGRKNTWSITDNLVWVKPMWSVYKGDSPGNGEIFKWDRANLARTPKLVFRNNIVRVGRTPFQVGDTQREFYVPPGTDFRNNVLVWDGPGSPPPSLTAWFDEAHGSRVGTMADWDAAVTAWRAAHPDVP